jgi:hypothetical protein
MPEEHGGLNYMQAEQKVPVLVESCLWYCAVHGHGVERVCYLGSRAGGRQCQDGLIHFQPRVTGDGDFVGKLLNHWRHWFCILFKARVCLLVKVLESCMDFDLLNPLALAGLARPVICNIATSHSGPCRRRCCLTQVDVSCCTFSAHLV